MVRQSYKAYANATLTVAKTKQIVMLYDAAIRNVQHAVEAIENKQIEARFHALNKACTIVFGLQGSLDFEQGGAIAKTLFDFYSSIDARLISVHRSNDAAMCQQVIKELKMMREAWADIDQMGAELERDAEATATPNPPKDDDNSGTGIIISA